MLSAAWTWLPGCAAVAIVLPAMACAQSSPGGGLFAAGEPSTGNVAAAEDQPGTPPANRPPLRSLPSGQILARVGSEVILAGDVLPRVNQILEEHAAEASPAELDQARDELVQRLLPQFIESKLLYVAAKRGIPAENLQSVQDRIADEFEAKQLPKLLEQAEVSTRAELEASLARYGTSIEARRRAFVESVLGRQWARQNLELERTISHDELLDEYRKNIGDYELEAKARWQELMVRFDRFPSRQAAYRTIAAMGNDVFRGAAWEQVARAASHGFTAAEGGMHDWTTKGSLKAKQINRALFTLPVGQLSPILESELGFHIVRVTERRDAGRTPFVDAQVKIREKLAEEHRQAEIKRYVESVRKDTPVWTIYDSGPRFASPPNAGASTRY